MKDFCLVTSGYRQGSPVEKPEDQLGGSLPPDFDQGACIDEGHPKLPQKKWNMSVSENVLFCCIPAIYGNVQRENWRKL